MSCLSVFVEARDIFEVGFSLPSANLSELTAPPAGEVSQGRTAGKGGHAGLAAPKLPAHGLLHQHLSEGSLHLSVTQVSLGYLSCKILYNDIERSWWFVSLLIPSIY